MKDPEYYRQAQAPMKEHSDVVTLLLASRAHRYDHYSQIPSFSFQQRAPTISLRIPTPEAA